MIRLLASLLLSGVIFRKDYWKYVTAPKNGTVAPSKWKVWWCRMNCHPAGSIWYDAGGTVPDYRCKTCNDNLG